MMAILAIAIGDPSCGTLGKLGIQCSIVKFVFGFVCIAINYCCIGNLALHCNTGTGTRTEAQVGDTELLSWGSSIVTGDTHCVLGKSFPNLMAVESCPGLKGTLINSKLRLRLCE